MVSEPFFLPSPGILFLNNNLEEAKNLKLILCVFEQLSGLKINFHKSEIFCFGSAKDVETQFTHLFGCEVGAFPFRYLGIPIHFKKLRNRDWKGVEDRFEKKLSSWKGKNMSVGGRLVLINSVLSSLLMFMFSFFEVPREVLKRLDYYRSRFYWQSDNHKRKYMIAKWSLVWLPKEHGGLGVQNLDTKNKSLLGKWLFKLLNEEGVWQSLLTKKYLGDKSLSQVVNKPGTSHF